MAHDLTVRFLGVRGSIATRGTAVGGAVGNDRIAIGLDTSAILHAHLHRDHGVGPQFFTRVYAIARRRDGMAARYRAAAA